MCVYKTPSCKSGHIYTCMLYTKVNANAEYVHNYVIALCIRVYKTYYIDYTSLATCQRSLEYIHSVFIPGHELVSLDYIYNKSL